jgi:hypothetical protein
VTSDASDAPVLPCIVDGGDASGDCCPDDPDKTQPGQCGCGMSDIDSDYDGVADCHDLCPGDPSKTAPGTCGCFIMETDTDHDGTPDCIDGCPANPARTAPGLCGCALPDSAAPACLAHRYSFNDVTPSDGGITTDAGADGGGGGVMTTVRDSVGTADGTAMNGVILTGNGSVTLAGGTSDQYISLPSGIISSLGNSATIEAWVVWAGTGGFWQRIFDFGVSDAGRGQQGTGTSFIFVTPQGGAAGVTLWSVNTGGLTEVLAPTIFPAGPIAGSGAPHHVAAVINAVASGVDGGTASNAALYIDGVLIGTTTPLTSQLSILQDVNNWLGRSQFILDPEFTGTYYEVRIHSSAMSQAQVTASFNAGPDILP